MANTLGVIIGFLLPSLYFANPSQMPVDEYKNTMANFIFVKGVISICVCCLCFLFMEEKPKVPPR